KNEFAILLDPPSRQLALDNCSVTFVTSPSSIRQSFCCPEHSIGSLNAMAFSKRQHQRPSANVVNGNRSASVGCSFSISATFSSVKQSTNSATPIIALNANETSFLC